MTDAILEASDADISIHNVYGGIRAELPEGELTYGSVFRMFPFDNRIAIVEMTGRDVRRIIEKQAHSENRPAGFSGMRVFVSCIADQMSIRMVRPDGSEIDDDDALRVDGERLPATRWRRNFHPGHARGWLRHAERHAAGARYPGELV